jgi:hypothetical protein
VTVGIVGANELLGLKSCLRWDWRARCEFETNAAVVLLLWLLVMIFSVPVWRTKSGSPCARSPVSAARAERLRSKRVCGVGGVVGALFEPRWLDAGVGLAHGGLVETL